MAKSKLKRRANKSKKGAQDEVDPSHAKVSKGASKRPRGKEVSKTNDEEMTATVGPGASSTSKETFQVEFEFFDPEEEDFHSVRDLLCSGTFGALDLDFSGIANSIVDQVNIGTMVKSGAEEAQQSQEAPASDEDDVTLCGMLTILNLRQFSEQVWCKNLVALLESKVKSDKQMLQYTRASGKEQLVLHYRVLPRRGAAFLLLHALHLFGPMSSHLIRQIRRFTADLPAEGWFSTSILTCGGIGAGPGSILCDQFSATIEG
eukprot:symbB.v1.2.029868.t1/scaffold3241.1/size60449/3